ncbi:MAG: hypothetical protein ACRDE2_04250, partial [Chitinophagaceae bacterium]
MNERNFSESKLFIGWATEDVTPIGRVPLAGQYYERISQYVQSPLLVTACAIESINKNGEKDQAVMVSMDLVYPLKDLQDSIRNEIKGSVSDLDISKLFLNATHTHSAPEPNITSEYGKILLKGLSKAIVSAWNNRTPAGISRSLSYVTVGHNRRVRYHDGTAEMYGATNRPDFIGLEGPEDAGVNMIFCWDIVQNLTGVIINVPCPAQVTEAKYFVSADYWGEVR